LPRLLPILILLIASGCVDKGGKAEVLRNDEQGIYLKTPRGFELWYGDIAEFASALESPADAEQPSSIDENGNIILGKVRAALAASVNDKTAWMFAGAGILLMLAGVLLAWKGRYKLAGMVGGLGIFVAGFPVLMEKGGAILAGLFIVAVVALGVAGVWMGMKAHRKRELESARESAAKLMPTEPRAAVAVLREAKAPEWPIENVKADAAEVKAMVAPPQP
jgi:hypothetical protein